MYREALSLLEGDPEFPLYRDYPKIKKLHEELKRKAAETPARSR